MWLKDLFPNFGKLSQEEQHKYIAEYRLRRAQDLATIPVKVKTTTTKSGREKIELTAEEKALMKMLGLKQKDVMALRSTHTEEQADIDDKPEDLFKDDTFEMEGEDE